MAQQWQRFTSWVGADTSAVRVGLGIGALLVVCGICSVGLAVANGGGGKSTTANTVPTATSRPTALTATPQPTAKPTATAVVHYPPTTQADLRGLAAKGNASAIHEFHSESVGLGVCPQPKREVTVDPSVTGQQLAEDLLAYFYGQQLVNPCGSVVGAYHSQSEA